MEGGHCHWVPFQKGEQGRLAFANKSLFSSQDDNMRTVTATCKPNMAAFLPSGGEADEMKGRESATVDTLERLQDLKMHCQDRVAGLLRAADMFRLSRFQKYYYLQQSLEYIRQSAKIS